MVLLYHVTRLIGDGARLGIAVHDEFAGRGFEREGVRRKAYFTAGRYSDALLMARLR